MCLQYLVYIIIFLQIANLTADANQVNFPVTVTEGAFSSANSTYFHYQAALTPIITSISDNVGLVGGIACFAVW